MKKTVLHSQSNQIKTWHEIPVIFGAAAKFAVIIEYVYLLSNFLMLPITIIIVTVKLLVLFINYY